MISALGKVGTYFTRGAKAVKPYIKTVSTVIKSLPKDMVTLSTSAKKVAKAPKNNRIILSFTSLLLSGLIPATIIFQAKTTIAINIGVPIIPAIIQYHFIIKFHVLVVNGAKLV